MQVDLYNGCRTVDGLFLQTEWNGLSVLVTTVSSAKMAEPIEMLLWSRLVLKATFHMN